MEKYLNLKSRLLKDEKIKREYDALGLEFAIAGAIIEKRLKNGLTQAELAEKIGTKQSAISRLESGAYNPSITFLQKIAKALNLDLTISFSNR
ncbi:helix-turn-helix transcriptional regulator [Candidatus Peregrinibacteria bacterium]|jgi:ribosome-binding protein aMBF1 (putative translation factor)|nr:helix-turn-helix transcriptional regulator [Candidatus Peregrinibacteria bacterium]